MSFLITKNDRIICQGITGKSGTFHIEKSLLYGTNIVAGVTPGKGGKVHLNLPVFDTVREAVFNFHPFASIIFVPSNFAKDSILEAIFAGIRVIVCITEGIPLIDMLIVKRYLGLTNSILIGPNCPGFVIPEIARLGIMPNDIHLKGVVGIVSRSGTLTYEAIMQTTAFGLGQSVSIGIGGDPIIGMEFIDVLALFENDSMTKIVLIIGEIGGNAEEKAAEFIKNMKKPVVAYIAGMSAPKGKKMGHAGAIILDKSGNPYSKINTLKKAGVYIVDSISNIGKTLSDIYNKNFF